MMNKILNIQRNINSAKKKNGHFVSRQNLNKYKIFKKI